MKVSRKAIQITTAVLAVSCIGTAGVYAYEAPQENTEYQNYVITASSSIDSDSADFVKDVVIITRGTEDGKLQISEDGGKTWKDYTAPATDGNEAVRPDVVLNETDSADPNTAYTITYTASDAEPGEAPADAMKLTEVMVRENDGKFQTSEDGGKTWKDIDFQAKSGDKISIDLEAPAK